MENTLKTIGNNFNLLGEFEAWEQITNGNINSTYKVSYVEENKCVDYVFQKINTVAFHHPEEIMMNIDKVTSYIHEHFPNENTLVFYVGSDGNNFFYDDNKNFWRVMNYVDSITYDSTNEPEVIEGVGYAFGHFAMQLSEFDGSVLYDTIPDFHNTYKRLETLFTHAKEKPVGRTLEVAPELEYIKSVREEASKLSLQFGKEIPIRVTHNDTKCNNVLFDKVTNKPLVVIDYDTIMPGMVIYDFADAVRSIANTCDEGETNLLNISLDDEKFKHFCKGYINQVKNALSPYEIESMPLAVFSITIELASRFLDDYICGDVYFKINYPQHNLDRARNQLALAKDMYKKFDFMNKVIKQMINE